MASIRNPQCARSSLLQLAKQHFTTLDLQYRALQCIASIPALGICDRNNKDKTGLLNRPSTCAKSRMKASKSLFSTTVFETTQSQLKSNLSLRRAQSGRSRLSGGTNVERCLVKSFSSSRNRPQKAEKKVTLDALPQVEIPSPEHLFGFEPPMFQGSNTDFPCVTRLMEKNLYSEGKTTGPEPEYHKVTSGFQLCQHDQPFDMSLNNGRLPRLDIAYETWGELNADRSNAVIVLAGLSASSHARSSLANPAPGWWEKFVGPGCAVDTNKFFVICPNNLGGCYGTSGPSSTNVLTGKPYATTFPIMGVVDMVNSIFVLLNHLGIDKLYGCVGSSLGGMLSLQSSVSYPDRVGRLITISSCAQSHPSSIAMRYLQRKCIMSDPHWNKGHYYDGPYPKVGMKLAREIATITYRSGPEWGNRFGRDRISKDPPSLCPTFSIESYLEHQGESFSTKYDPNSLLYMSKAMDMFDIGDNFDSVEAGLSQVACPVMVIGVQTDVLFPIWQQRDLASQLQAAGNKHVTFYELNSLYGHDTFLLDLNGVGAAVKGFLETDLSETGWVTKHNITAKDGMNF